MDIVVYNKKLKKILDDKRMLERKIGAEMAKILTRRFREIQSSNNFKEYIDNSVGKPHPLTGKLSKIYGIHLTKNYRLLVEPLTDLFSDEGLKECKSINVKGVVDYHGEKIEWLIP